MQVVYFGLICVFWYYDLCKSMYDVSVGGY